MISTRHALTQRFLTAAGRLGRPADRVFYTPDLIAARALTGASVVYLVFFLCALSGLSQTLSFLVVVGLLGTLLYLRRMAELLLTLLSLGLLMVLTVLARSSGILAFLLVVFALVVCIRYLARHAASAHLGTQFPRLARHLGQGWKAYLPKEPLAQHHARVLVGPSGQTFFLGVTAGRPEQKYGTPHVVWSGLLAEDLRDHSRRDPGVVQDGQTVLWVTRPAGAEGEYTITLAEGVSTVIGTSEELAGHLNTWSTMVANLQTEPATPREEGRAVERQAIGELEENLPAGWSLRTNLLLAHGGDADIELTSPAGQRYVIDVKARTDRMDLSAPRGERMKSWPEIHGQVTRAARQLQGVGVVWQPRTTDEDFYLVEGLWCLRGSARTLMEALETLGAADVTQEQTPQQVLGVAPHASREEIQAAFKQLARQYHPDRVASLGEEFRHLAERRMKAINAAYQALID